MVAAIGMDGTRLKVFGLGVTEEDAVVDALVRMAVADVELVDDEPPALASLKLTDDQAKAVAQDLAARDRAPGMVAGRKICPARSGLPCEYNQAEDPCHDECVHCGAPEERK